MSATTHPPTRGRGHVATSQRKAAPILCARRRGIGDTLDG